MDNPYNTKKRYAQRIGQEKQHVHIEEDFQQEVQHIQRRHYNGPIATYKGGKADETLTQTQWQQLLL